MEEIKGKRLFFYNFSNAGQALLDTFVMGLYSTFLLPPAENIQKGMIQYLPNGIYFGIFTVIALMMIVGRFFDGFADPVVTSLSDRSKSRLGRRRLFMIIGGLPMALSAVLVFFPPVPSASWINVVYLTVMFSVFFISYTTYVAPYIALIPEFGRTEKKRINITTVQAYFALFGGAIALIGGPYLLGFFEGIAGPVQSYQYTAIIMGVIALIFLYVAVFAVDEKRFSNAVPSNVPIMKSIGITFKNKKFIIFLLANLCFWFVFQTLRAAVIPFAEAVLGESKSAAGTYNIIIFGSSAIYFILVNFLTKKLGKKVIYICGLLAFGAICVYVGMTGLVPGIDPKIWAIVGFMLLGFPVAIFLSIPNVFISEICDLDLKETGEHREGIYFGVHGFFQTLTMAASASVLSFLFLAFGKDLANPTGIRMTFFACAVAALVGFVIFLFYTGKKEFPPGRDQK